MKAFLITSVIVSLSINACNADGAFDLHAIYARVFSETKELTNYLINIIYKENKGDHCMKDPIYECSCYEMLFAVQDLDPHIIEMNRKDIKHFYKKSSLIYHPDKPTGNDAAFDFLTKCQEVLSMKKNRYEYRKQLQRWLKMCNRTKLDEIGCRDGIHDVNIEEILNAKMPKYRPPILTTSERTFIFLDNSWSMSVGTNLEKGHRYLTKIKPRIIDSGTNIYLIGSKPNCAQIVGEGEEVDDNYFQNKIMRLWDGDGGLTYLWEYIWESVKENEEPDCEIIIITDGYDTESSEHFNGVIGFDKLMLNLKDNNKPLCRVYVHCISSECKDEIGKHYRDLTLASGGFFCNDDNAMNCSDILNMPNAIRKEWAKLFRGEYYGLLQAGEARLLSWTPDVSSQHKEL